ncbi:LLM class flavin-dependent oxidoreductase [Schumannella soli]|uniref:LLM class flavin-dependent oxidoreductase n=1 Tax=Schumannella soli TaxID=2590779 RepID=A0A506Y5K7_9MICO|nr:LLM class flavin-dependent oxidoreductase [Schumannella soli]TPW75719.1 LLM class flavin-dependent oxidoreductase [Schumannella soli]
MPRPLHLGVALDGAGWHPQAWRTSDLAAGELFTAAYWTRLARRADEARLDLLTIEDAFAQQTAAPFTPDDRRDQVRGRLDAGIIASFLAPLTRSIGLVPTLSTTHSEPFHLATAVQTLDYASRGRAGWRPKVSADPREARQFGRRDIPAPDFARFQDPTNPLLLELFGEAAEVIEAGRQLWDSWQDDAIIRDVATGRFIDRDRVHRIGFEGEHFSVESASIMPRSPQGQPLVTVLAHARIPYELAAGGADVVYVTPHDEADAVRILGEVREAERAVGRADRIHLDRPLEVWADAVVLLDDSVDAARAALAELEQFDGAAFTSDALIHAGTAESLAEQLLAWQRLGYDGVRLRPARLPADLDRIADDLVPLLRDAGVLDRPDATTLRGRLGLSRPASRYATDHSSPELEEQSA